jgi:hypothetical protein
MVSSLDVFSYLVFAITEPILVYAAFWAFNIRKALFVRLYRNQALGIGLSATGLGIIELAQLLEYTVRILSSSYFIPILYLIFMTIFYWIDTSISTARRSDPLLRNTFHWRTLRKVLWPFVILVVAILSPWILFFGFLQGPSSQLAVLIVLFVLLFAPIWIPPICASVILPVATRRSKDITLHRQLTWFAVFAIFTVGLVILSPATGTEYSTSFAQQLVGVTALSGAGYALYRSAKSLVPLNRLSLDAEKK